MSKMTNVIESVRSHPQVAKRIHVHRGDVIVDPATAEGSHVVTICAAHRWASVTVDSFGPFAEALWPDAIMGPELMVPVHGHVYQHLTDGEQIETTRAWLESESVQVHSGVTGAKIPEKIHLRRAIHLHVYAASWHLRRCQVGLIEPQIYIRR